MNDLDIIVKMIFGSHLYGTATENSDKDYMGVFLPSKRQICLNKVPKLYSFSTKKDGDTRNTPDDVDTKIFSLHYFIKLACEGQTEQMDMLHAPKSMLLEYSAIWDTILMNREKFYTKNLQAFIGYARRQASKYGIKGSRLDAVGKVVKELRLHEKWKRLSDIWAKLPIGEHIHIIDAEPSYLRQYQVCGKKFQETSKIGYVLPILSRFSDEYGERARLAKENKNIDWKAVSHALRAAYQVRQILTINTIAFPLKQADFLRDVKLGKKDYLTEVVPVLESLMDEVEELSRSSSLPDKVDRYFWEDFIVDVVEEYIL